MHYLVFILNLCIFSLNHDFSGNNELTLSTTARMPSIQNPKDVLIEIKAASVNPIDVRMRGKFLHLL